MLNFFLSLIYFWYITSPSFNITDVNSYYKEKVRDRSKFSPVNENGNLNVFRMVLPPPNVTGDLHIGHALTVAIENAFCRYQSHLGKNVIF